MRSTLSAKLVSILLLLIILFSCVVCPVICCGESLSGPDMQVSEQHQIPADSAGPYDSEGFNPDDHDHVCISCPCHAPLACCFTQPVYAPAISTVSSLEIFHYLPDVYLPKFIPPQNRA